MLLLLVTGCAGSAQLGGPAATQAIEQLLTAPTAVCTAVLTQQMTSLAALKMALTQPMPALLPASKP